MANWKAWLWRWEWCDQVRFLGALTRVNVRQAMWHANGFVLPSYAENFGVVLIELLSTGIPAIATRCGSPADFATSDVGILLNQGDEMGLISALQEARVGLRLDATMLREYAVRRLGDSAVGAILGDVDARALGWS